MGRIEPEKVKVVVREYQEAKDRKGREEADRKCQGGFKGGFSYNLIHRMIGQQKEIGVLLCLQIVVKIVNRNPLLASRTPKSHNVSCLFEIRLVHAILGKVLNTKVRELVRRNIKALRKNVKF
ncbi:hypothetical protein KSP40_PGU002480 [Platanthera guangdongensis]|uniref:Uncharacterized protein n=1 Tax=Platanthera guangdongensis TaxID=2320717 RepID=A0ABR2M005_9ASPA